jgi:hypothetical protein
MVVSSHFFAIPLGIQVGIAVPAGDVEIDDVVESVIGPPSLAAIVAQEN